jgi:hypothetical protein
MLARFAAGTTALVLAVLASAAVPAQLTVEYVDPVTVTSPSGQWSLSIDPSRLSGKGPAAYRLVKGKEVVWAAELPFTLCDVQLGEDGAFAGTTPASEDHLRLMLIGPDGTARFDKTLPDEAHLVHGPAYPISPGTFLQDAGERVVFRVVHYDEGDTSEVWVPVRWSDGTRLSETPPVPPLPYETRRAPDETDAEGPPLPSFELEYLGAIKLDAGEPQPVRFWGFDIDDRGRLGCVTGVQGGALRFLLRDEAGATISDVALPPAASPDEPAPESSFWIRGDRWLVYGNNSGDGDNATGDDHRAAAWWLDLPAGTLTAIPAFACPSIDAGDGTFDGGFVVLTTQSKPYSSEHALESFDADGKLRWRDVVWGHPSESGLFSPDDVRVSPRGEIGVLDNIRNEIQRFDLAGKLVGAIELEQVLGREPSYLTLLGVDGEGNWSVYDFDGEPPVLRISHDGALMAGCTPHFADGRRLGPWIHLAPDGRLWGSDGYALLRLDADGTVDRIVGELPDANTLGEVECAVIDVRGRIALADQRTHAVHVFDPAGAKTAVCNLPAANVTERTRVGCIAIAPGGSVHVGLSDFPNVASYCVFDTAGVSLRDEAVNGECLFQPDGERRWMLDYGGIRLLDVRAGTAEPGGAEGRGDAATPPIARSPDGRWLYSLDSASVAPDGSLAVTSRDGLHIYSPVGEPVRTLPLPPGEIRRHTYMAFTGTRVFLGHIADLWCVDVPSGAVSRTSIASELSANSWTLPFWRPDIGELWIMDQPAKRVLRYREKP